MRTALFCRDFLHSMAKLVRVGIYRQLHVTPEVLALSIIAKSSKERYLHRSELVRVCN